LLLHFAFLALSTLSQAQTERGRGNYGDGTPSFKVRGMVSDENNTPVEYATVTLFSVRDSSLVTGSISGPDGRFEITTRPGWFYLIIDFIGYGSKRIDGIHLGGKIKVLMPLN